METNPITMSTMFCDSGHFIANVNQVYVNRFNVIQTLNLRIGSNWLTLQGISDAQLRTIRDAIAEHLAREQAHIGAKEEAQCLSTLTS